MHGRYGDLQEVREPGPKDIEEAAGTEKAMKMLRELLSSDPVSSDEDMGDTEEEDEQGKKQLRCTATPLTWWRWLTQLKEESYNAAASTSPITRAGNGMRHHPVLHPEVRRHN